MVATDYFTKWVEAIPLKMVTSKNMVDFVKEHIVYHFGIPQTITTDQGTYNEEITYLDLLLPQITKYHGMDTKDLH